MPNLQIRLSCFHVKPKYTILHLFLVLATLCSQHADENCIEKYIILEYNRRIYYLLSLVLLLLLLWLLCYAPFVSLAPRATVTSHLSKLHSQLLKCIVTRGHFTWRYQWLTVHSREIFPLIYVTLHYRHWSNHSLMHQSCCLCRYQYPLCRMHTSRLGRFL